MNKDESNKHIIEEKIKRISQLEELLTQYEKRIYELENEKEKQENNQPIAMDIDIISNHTKELTEKLNESEKEILSLKKEKKMLEKENASLDQLVGKLEVSLGRGEYNPETTRVLQLARNPELDNYSIRKTTLDLLRNENKVLLNIVKNYKLKNLERTEEEEEGNENKKEPDQDSQEHKSGDSNNENDNGKRYVPIESYERLEKENERIKYLEKQLDRLKSVFRIKSKEYREVVYSLLGYRFDFLQDGRVRLTSMYSQQGNHSFVFASNPDDSGIMQLTGGNKSYIQSLDKRIEYFVGKYGSIPGLLASVTLDLFNQLKEQQDSQENDTATNEKDEDHSHEEPNKKRKISESSSTTSPDIIKNYI